MSEDLIREFQNELQKLVGKECWGVIAGMGTGSVVNFKIGNKVLRSKPVKNPNLTEVVRNYKSEYGLFVKCAWRLDSKTEVVCGCWDDNRKGHKMLVGLDLLIDCNIMEVVVSQPAFDLSILFSNHLNLKIFCDQVDENDDVSNYDFFTPGLIYTVGPRSELRRGE